jgi:hypothetical protein
MKSNLKTLHTKSEVNLAAYQRKQIGNTCSFHAITAGIKLLLNFDIDPIALSQEINRLWWQGRFMRIAPNWAVTPHMQVRIIRYLARTRQLPIRAKFIHGTPEILHQILSDSQKLFVPIVTIVWCGRRPDIYYGNAHRNSMRTNIIGGHSMIPAAYDPEHISQGGSITQWGFINSWKDQANHLFWMRENDFYAAWRFWIPFIGPNPLVLMECMDDGLRV